MGYRMDISLDGPFRSIMVDVSFITSCTIARCVAGRRRLAAEPRFYVHERERHKINKYTLLAEAREVPFCPAVFDTWVPLASICRTSLAFLLPTLNRRRCLVFRRRKLFRTFPPVWPLLLSVSFFVLLFVPWLLRFRLIFRRAAEISMLVSCSVVTFVGGGIYSAVSYSRVE